MKLAEFYRQVAPVLEGRVAIEKGTRALYPHPSLDSKRLAIYARFCRIHRGEALNAFSYTRDQLVARVNEEAWEELAERTFRTHPMRHFELNENAAPFPSLLPAELRRLKLPRWLAELADFEWWEWRTRTALDSPDDAHDRGPLRLASTVELRPYSRRWVEWIDELKREGDPEERPAAVIFWRDRDLDTRREPASELELAVIKSVFEGQPGEQTPGPKEAVRETLDDLRHAGIVRGGEPG